MEGQVARGHIREQRHRARARGLPMCVQQKGLNLSRHETAEPPCGVQEQW